MRQRKSRRIITLLVAIALLLSLATTAYAQADEPDAAPQATVESTQSADAAEPQEGESTQPPEQSESPEDATEPEQEEQTAAEEPTATEEEPAEEQSEAPAVEAEEHIQAVNFLKVAPFLAAVQSDGDEQPDNGMVYNKTAEPVEGEKGTYKITLEAYATGSKVITETTKEVPTDIVLVLDQSGSMEDSFGGTYTYTAYTRQTNSNYYTNREDLYYKLDNDSYAKVTVSQRSSGIWNQTYTYTYTDAEGRTQTIATSEGRDANPNATFYRRSETATGGTKKLDALKAAVSTFASAVATKSSDDVKHRIAVVGFASGPNSYKNTELFIGSTQYQYDGNTISSQYKNAFQDMSTENGKNNVTASINALDAKGATYPSYGMGMANEIFKANPVTGDEQRNRVVIVFTDGVPGYSSYESSVANSAINAAQTTKGTHGATVYTVGIFDGADAKSAGNQYGITDAEKANWFMQNLSSNNGTVQTPSYYLSANDSDSLNNIFKQISDHIEEGGASTTLDKEAIIRDAIPDQFELPEGATDDDITLKTYSCTGKEGDEYTWGNVENATGVTATIDSDKKTVSVTGFDYCENYVGTETAANGTVTYRGKKLVISFNIKVRDGYLGGNDVATNDYAKLYANEADATDDKAVLTFPEPKVNIQIRDVTVVAPNENVYLTGSVTGANIKAGTTVTVEDVYGDPVTLNLSEKNYDLDSWQYGEVNITVTFTDAEGNDVENFNDLKDDTTYTVSVAVAPKTTEPSTSIGEPATTQTGSNGGNIYVYKPELTFKDREVYVGDPEPTPEEYNEYNYVSTAWKHTATDGTSKTSTDQGVVMLGKAPTLSLTYTPGEGVTDGKITGTNDIEVKVDVKIDNTNVTSYCKFVHQPCNPACGWTEPTTGGDPAFLLHPKNMTLTIRKTVSGSGANPKQHFTFKIKANGVRSATAEFTGNDGCGVEHSETLTFNNGEAEVQLKHGERVIITGIRASNVDITETNKGDYELTAKVNGETAQIGENDTLNVTLGKNVKDVEFNNDYIEAPPSGVVTDNLPFIIIGACVLAGACALFLRRKKHAEF